MTADGTVVRHRGRIVAGLRWTRSDDGTWTTTITGRAWQLAPEGSKPDVCWCLTGPAKVKDRPERVPIDQSLATAMAYVAREYGTG